MAALNTLEIFGTISGLKINTDKTKIVWIGKKKNSLDKFDIKQKLAWGTSEFNLLGLTFSVNLKKMVSLNYSSALNKVRTTLNRWKKRNLTPLGKITVIKTFIISAFNHLFSAIPSPDAQFMSQLNHLLYSFIWDNKPHKVSCKQMTNTNIKGGFNMTDIENFILSQKLIWIKRLVTRKSAPWSRLISSMFDTSKLYNLGSIWSKRLAIQMTNPFWKEVLFSWYKFLSIGEVKKVTCSQYLFGTTLPSHLNHYSTPIGQNLV